MSHKDARFVLPTRVGYADDGENYYMGHAVIGDLMQRELSFWSLLSLSVGHRLLNRAEEKQLEDLAVAIISADPRIWPHKLMRLAAAFGSKAYAIAAICNFSENLEVGSWAYAETAQFYLSINKDSEDGDLDEAIENAIHPYIDKKRPIPSFGTPMRQADERCIALDEFRQRKGTKNGKYWKLYKAVTLYVEANYNVKVNIAAPAAAIFLDLGFNCEQINSASIALVTPVWLSHAHEGAQQAPDVLQCLPDKYISYQGPELRRSPRDLASKPA